MRPGTGSCQASVSSGYPALTLGMNIADLDTRRRPQFSFIMPELGEDDVYRASTQFRLWSYTRGALASLRATTNATAADGVRYAIKSLHSSRPDPADIDSRSNGKVPTKTNVPKEVDCLTVEEEQKLVGFYCVKTMQFADFCEFPTNLKVRKSRLILLTPEPPKISRLSPGYGSTVPQAFLPFKLSHDLPPQRNDAIRSLFSDKDREPLYIPQSLRI